MEIRRPDLEDVFLQVMSGTSASNIPLEGAASAAAPARSPAAYRIRARNPYVVWSMSGVTVPDVVGKTRAQILQMVREVSPVLQEFLSVRGDLGPSFADLVNRFDLTQCAQRIGLRGDGHGEARPRVLRAATAREEAEAAVRVQSRYVDSDRARVAVSGIATRARSIGPDRLAGPLVPVARQYPVVDYTITGIGNQAYGFRGGTFAGMPEGLAMSLATDRAGTLTPCAASR